MEASVFPQHNQRKLGSSRRMVSRVTQIRMLSLLVINLKTVCPVGERGGGGCRVWVEGDGVSIRCLKIFKISQVVCCDVEFCDVFEVFK